MTDEVDRILDVVFRWTDERFTSGDFASVDAVLGRLTTCPQLDVSVGLLCATFCARDRLTQRQPFMSLVAATFGDDEVRGLQ